MDASLVYGSIGFGMVIGWITYYTMRKNTKERTLADITVIISALIGPAVLAVFPSPANDKTTMFGYYGIGLAIGFFVYYIIFVLLLWKAPDKLLYSLFRPQGGAAAPDATPAGGTTGLDTGGGMRTVGQDPDAVPSSSSSRAAANIKTTHPDG